MCLLLVLIRVTGCRLEGERLPDGAAKGRLLEAIGKATEILALASVLKVIGLSQSRYHAWQRLDRACELTDRRSCPKKSPGQLTAMEVEAIRQLATSEDYRHMPTSTLSRFAQRAGKVYASASTWLRLIRERGWRRPRTRIHPAKPTCTVDEFLANGTLKRVLAQVEIVESNSLVESFWRGLKHSVMPHSALDYRTPDEVYFGRAEDLPSNLEVARRTAREARMAINRATSCEACGASMSSPTALEEAA